MRRLGGKQALGSDSLICNIHQWIHCPQQLGNQAGQGDAFCFLHGSATPISTRRPTPARQQLSLNIQLNLFSVSCQHPGSPECLCGCILSSAACWLATLLLPPEGSLPVLQGARHLGFWESNHRCWSTGLRKSGQGPSRSLGKAPRP